MEGKGMEREAKGQGEGEGDQSSAPVCSIWLPQQMHLHMRPHLLACLLQPHLWW
jgi:hypothetical protein